MSKTAFKARGVGKSPRNVKETFVKFATSGRILYKDGMDCSVEQIAQDCRVAITPGYPNHCLKYIAAEWDREDSSHA
ncbi:MAG TPA: hypothetical protein VGO47_01445 [Chlamydiales bacterium]|nr:hypothetical protein [Chlamydiales bacterium]